MFHKLHRYLFHFAWIVAACGWCTTLQAQTPADSLQLDTDSLLTDSLPPPPRVVDRDSVLMDSLRKEATFESPLKYRAKDSIVFDLRTNSLLLFTDGNTLYQDKDLTADRIRVNWQQKLIYAEGRRDTSGKVIGKPVFKEGDDIYNADSIVYNYETEKGRISYARTDQDGDIILGTRIKRNPDKSFYIQNGIFTTCDAEHPHFYIFATKIKMIPEDKIISGPLYMAIADVPIPLVLPFGYFPISQKRASGILLPEYGSTADRGFFFRNMGYYWAMSKYNDARLTATIFTNGSYQLTLNSSYTLRYAFDGNFNFDWADERFNQKGDPDYTRQNRYFLTWNHNQRVNPLTRFTSNVRFGASNFLQRNSFNLQDNLQTNLASSISWQQSFPRAGWNLTANLNHRQDLRTKQVELGLPDLVMNKDRFFPFRKEGSTGRSWYESIGVTYSTQFRNQINTYDSLLFTTRFDEDMRYGLQHNAAINTNFKVLKHLNLTPSLRYREVWYDKSQQYSNPFITQDSVFWTGAELQRRSFQQFVADTAQINGFAAGRDFGASLALSTNVYGMMLTNGPRKRAFRHTMVPTLSYNFQPDFSDPGWGFYDTYNVYDNNAAGEREARTVRSSRFAKGIFGGPGQGMQQAVNFNLANQWQMKATPLKTPGDTAKVEPVYTNLIDNLGASTSYNFAAEAFRLSDVSVQFRNNVAKGLLNINLNGRFSPYAMDTNGTRIDEYLWNQPGGNWLRLENAGLALSTSLRSSDLFKKKKEDAADSTKAKKDAPPLIYMPFSMPWNLSLSYTSNLTRRFDRNAQRMQDELVHSLNASLNFELTEFWKVRASTNYDFQTGKLGATQLSLSRDLHCWVMAFNAIPFGRFRRYDITINVKAASLQDLRLQKQRNWQDRFTQL